MMNFQYKIQLFPAWSMNAAESCRFGKQKLILHSLKLEATTWYQSSLLKISHFI